MRIKKILCIILTVILLFSVCVIPSVTASAAKTGNYEEFIKYRGQNLKNTYAKLSKGEEVNVLYCGGSVTNGTGASDEEKYSWRALTGNWLKENFEATVNNINVSYGGTGSYFGAYRVQRDVISKKPDLIFIEFSINDHYDNQVRKMSYEQSSKQFETIVHSIRTALPECDIITVLTTEKGYITVNQRGELHTHAQAHEDISEAYNIPSLHVGRALVSKLPYSNTVAEWNKYMMNGKDIVHPNDSGYKVYYEVVEEYLSNCLLNSNYDGTIKDHTLPRQVNDYLIDGDMQFIPGTQALVSRSCELGGSNFYYSSSTKLRGYDGGVYADGSNANFIFEFTGTEVAVLNSGSKNIEEFQVVVDGESNFVECYNIYPEVLVTGLKPGKHTMTIKPVYKNGASTGEFFIMGFFVRDETKGSAKYDHKVHKFQKYVSNKDATCKKDGTETAKCSVKGCDLTDTRPDVGSMLSHKYVINIAEKATLSSDGYGYKECSLCGRFESTVYIKSVKTIKLSTATYAYNGNVKTPAVTIKDSAGKVLEKDTDYTVTYATGRKKIGTYKVTVKLKGKYKGSKTLSFKIVAPVSVSKCSVKLSATSYTYNGKVKTPAVTVKNPSGKVLKKNTDYTVAYATGRKNVGTYKVTVKMKGIYTGTKTLTFKINPPKTSVNKVVGKTKSLVVAINKKSTQVTGYQVQYSASKKFDASKTKTISSYKSTKTTISVMSSNKIYYVRVRTYKKVGNTTYYSGWSTYKYAKTK